MAHKIPGIELLPKKERKITLPQIKGKIGLGFFIGGKEIFLGIVIDDVIIEQVTRKRMIKTPKSTVRTFNFEV